MSTATITKEARDKKIAKARDDAVYAAVLLASVLALFVVMLVVTVVVTLRPGEHAVMPLSLIAAIVVVFILPFNVGSFLFLHYKYLELLSKK